MDASALDRLIRVSISADRLAATVIIQPGLDPEFLTADLINTLLDQQVIARSRARDDAVADLVRAARERPDQPAHAIVARGVEPIHGGPGRFELAPRPAPPPLADPGATDHYQRTPFHVVHAGGRVGTLFPPADGIDGVDVTGQVLPSRRGAAANVRFDETVIVDAAGAVTAAIPGIVIFRDSSLRILDTLKIDGYVDFSTGNIDFPGHVSVGRGIRDCFTVRTGRSITVHELVEAARLEIGEDAILERGMAAREKGSLSVGRDLHAKYLDNVEARITRDAVIAKEVANCHLSVGRHFAGPGCSFVGGELFAMSAEIAQVGSRAGVATGIVLGRVAEVEDKAARLARAVVPMRKRVDALRDRLDQLRRGSGRLTATQAEDLTELQFEEATQQDRLGKLTHGLEAYLQVIAAQARGSLTFHRLLCAGVRLWIGGWRAEFNTELMGPATISLDAAGDPVITDPASPTPIPLSRLARIIADDRFIDVDRIRRDCGLPRAA
ncbi:MAG: DUF342 domain-containing protein [Phycisphaerales bacterium]|nr:DUF342 domain-containing protein [Phycisphaerales bacterium]